MDESVKKYNLILADPPWKYEHSVSRRRKVENHYSTLTLQQICSLNIDSVTEKDCILFLWVPAPKLEDGLQVMDIWGFKYRTNMVWDKERMGMGYYARNQHEHLLIGKKGKIHPPLPAARPRSVWRERSTEHSKKPDSIYDILEKMYPTATKLELFARQKRNGWDVFGDEVISDVELIIL